MVIGFRNNSSHMTHVKKTSELTSNNVSSTEK